MRVLFFGSSRYCLPILQSLKENFHLICAVTRDNSPIKSFAQTRNIKVNTPRDKVQLTALANDFKNLKPDLAIVADYGLIIPKEIFEIPKYKTLNIHFSNLPKYRGPSPVQYTILHGEKKAGITIFILKQEMDTGDIIWQRGIELSGSETTENLYPKLFNIAAKELPNIVSQYTNHRIVPIKQNHSKATYTRLLSRDDGFIPQDLLNLALKGIRPSKEQIKNWQLINEILQLPITKYQLPITIDRTLRAFTPWPGLWTELTLRHLGGSQMDSPEVERSEKRIVKRLKILKAHIEPQEPRTKNRELRTKLVIDQVQLEGKNPVSWKQFKEGYIQSILGDF